MLRKRSGIFVNIIQTGSIGRYSVTSVVLHISSGLGILTIVAYVVDFIAVSILPHKQAYEDLMYDTLDMEDVVIDDQSTVDHQVKPEPKKKRKKKNKRSKGNYKSY
eukprot:TRINITY_DN6800_c0_g1_i3.p1 TRINITY_DN6800_c0_g1~~TRINITY_DN6800_c0_g1_i3.p1  ORF type:complete len:106 (-),score=21.94 TRINITY_DN6800_c0_g1_i3:17-334(-)